MKKIFKGVHVEITFDDGLYTVYKDDELFMEFKIVDIFDYEEISAFTDKYWMDKDFRLATVLNRVVSSTEILETK